MSWDVELIGAGEIPINEEGGTYVLGGSTDPDLNITYNYSKFYYEELNKEAGLRWLHNKTAEETLPALERAVEQLGVERDSDYWKATTGNAGYALSILVLWAKLYPKATWEVN